MGLAPGSYFTNTFLSLSPVGVLQIVGVAPPDYPTCLYSERSHTCGSHVWFSHVGHSWVAELAQIPKLLLEAEVRCDLHMRNCTVNMCNWLVTTLISGSPRVQRKGFLAHLHLLHGSFMRSSYAYQPRVHLVP